jgi:hypothetical protein
MSERTGKKEKLFPGMAGRLPQHRPSESPSAGRIPRGRAPGLVGTERGLDADAPASEEGRTRQDEPHWRRVSGDSPVSETGTTRRGKDARRRRSATAIAPSSSFRGSVPVRDGAGAIFAGVKGALGDGGSAFLLFIEDGL